MPGRIHVIGGGLAGLAAALELTGRGRAVTLYEAGPACGGRCRSFFDRELGCRIDNGNHLLLSGNLAAMDFLGRVGARGTLTGPETPLFPFFDVRSGASWAVRPNPGRVPYWVLFPSRGVPGARMADWLALLRLRRARPDQTVAGVLPHSVLYEKLIEPLAIAALNTPPDQASAALFWRVLDETLGRGGANCKPCFPRDGLSESFVDPALAKLRQAGATLLTGTRIGALIQRDGRVVGLGSPEGSIDLPPGDQVVLAVPGPVAVGLLPGTVAPDSHEAIVNLHYRAHAPFGAAGFVGLVGGLAEWVFVKKGVVSVTISAANRLLDRAPEPLAAAVWLEVSAALGLAAPLPPWRVIREKRATFAATPAQQLRRPGATTTCGNVALAGDWTDTGLPATIEGAIRSGFAAAHHLCHPK